MKPLTKEERAEPELHIADHCVVIGPVHAERSYEFAFAVGTDAYRTVMTPEEYEVVRRVVCRAVEDPSDE